MSVLTPEHSAASARASAPAHHSSAPLIPRKPTFNRPVAPEHNLDRDNELIKHFFDGNWTTKDIAEHFHLPIPVVTAWLARSDIAAVIDSVAAANERRARDIARESLPGTVDILLRISRTRKDDKVACAASSALIRFSRGPASTSLIRKPKAKRPADGTCDFSAAARARRAGETPPRGIHNTRGTYSTPHAHNNDAPNNDAPNNDARTNDESTQPAPSQSAPAPGRDAESSPPARREPISPALAQLSTITQSVQAAIDPTASLSRIDNALAPHAPPRGSPADLVARAGSTFTQTRAGPSMSDLCLPVFTPRDALARIAIGSPTHAPCSRTTLCVGQAKPMRCRANDESAACGK